MPSSAEITLVVAGDAWRNWTSYEVSAQFETPADGWHVEARNPSSSQLAAIETGTVIILMVGSSVVLKGRLDRKELRRTTSGGTVVGLSGRDLAGQLVDCSTPTSWTFRNVSVATLATKALAALGITAVVQAHADAQVPMKWAAAEPGESYWQVIERYARKARLLPWMTPAGVLRIDRPDYTSAPVARLVNAASSTWRQDGNVLESVYVDDVTGRYTEVTVLGQGKGSDTLFGGSVAHLRGVATDTDLAARGLVRPLVLDDGDIRSSSEATARAEWEISHRRYQGRSLEYVVSGHGPSLQEVWSLDSMVQVHDELAGISDTWWLAGYRLLRDTRHGTRTALTLRPPNALLPVTT